jgi:hypothetical protein
MMTGGRTLVAVRQLGYHRLSHRTKSAGWILALAVIVVLWAGLLLAIPASAGAATLTMYPSGRDTANGRPATWVVVPTNGWATALDSNDGATSYGGGPSGSAAAANVFLNMDAVTAPTGPITAVTVTAFAAPGNGNANCTMRLGVANATSAAALQPTAVTLPASTAYASYSYSPATNPVGGAWTWADIASLRAVVQQTTRPTGSGATRQLRATQVYVTVTYTAQYTITSSAGANGAISPAGATVVNEGTNRSYAITPNAGYHVANVTVDGVSQGALTSYTFSNVTANHTIAATFALNTYTITTSAGANGTISPSSPTVNHGANQTFLIAANTGYHVADVIVDGASQGALASYTFNNVTAAGHTIAATFALNTYTITTSPGANGTITPPSPAVVGGANQTLSIAPNTGYHIADVIVDGVSQGAMSSFTFYNVTANHTIAATFALNTYMITASAGANGTISPSSVSVNHGANQAFAITANTGYHVTDVTVDGVSQGALTSYTFSNVTANHTISATFALNTFTITTSPGAHGTITPSSPAVTGGANQTLSITPNTGYHVADVLIDGASQGALGAYTFYNVIANHTISATFAINTYTITTSASANGTITPSSPSVNHGANQTFAINANTGYHVVAVTVDGVSQGPITSHTFTNVTASHTISASFAANSAALTVVSASSPAAGRLDVVFSQQMDGSTIQAADFSVAGLSVSSPVLQPDGLTVRLTTAQQTPGQSYVANVVLGSVRDTNGVALSAPNTASFTGHSGPWTETTPSSGVTLDFSQALHLGGSTAVVPPSRHSAPPLFSLLPGAYFDISTATQFAGTVVVTVPYNPSEVTGNPAGLRLFHWRNGAWQNITSHVNTANNTVSGVTDSFSEYAIGEATEDESGGIGSTTSSPASSDWSLALLGFVGAGLLLARARTKIGLAR